MSRINIIKDIEGDLGKLDKVLKNIKNKTSLEESTLDILGNIEEKISELLGNPESKTSNQKEITFKRYLSFNKISSSYESINVYLDKLIDILYHSIEENTLILNHDIFKRGTANIASHRKNKEKQEFKTSPKNKHFKAVLYNIGIPESSIQRYQEKLDTNRMRQLPYMIYHINTSQIQKTILISDEIGQATFIYDSIIDPEFFQSIEKGEPIQNIPALKIVYHQKTYRDNLEVGLNSQYTFEEKEEKIVNTEVELADETLTKENIFQTLWSYKGTEQESYDYFMNLPKGDKNTPDSIYGLKIQGKAVGKLKTLSGIQIEGNIRNLSGFQKFINKVFEGKDITNPQEKILQTLWQYKGSEQESYNYFMNLPMRDLDTINSIIGLRIQGRSVYELNKLSGIKIKGNIIIPSLFRNWIEQVFLGKGIITLQKQLLQTLWNYKGNEQDSYDYFMSLGKGNKSNGDSIHGLKIQGKGVNELKKLSGIQIEGNMGTPSLFQKWIQKVFEGKNIQRQDMLTKKKLLQTLWNYKGTEQGSYNYFMSLPSGNKKNQDSIHGLKIQGIGVSELRNISGREVKGDIACKKIFYNWVEQVFLGKDIITLQQQLLQTLWSYKGTEQESYKYFMTLGQGNKDTLDSIYGLKIQGKGVTQLRTLSGIQIEGNIKTPSGFQEFINKIFEGKGISQIRK